MNSIMVWTMLSCVAWIKFNKEHSRDAIGLVEPKIQVFNKGHDDDDEDPIHML